MSFLVLKTYIKNLAIMIYYFNRDEFELLQELECKFLVDSCFKADRWQLSLTGSQVRLFVLDLLEWIPLLNDKSDQKCLSDLAWKLVKKFSLG